MCLELAHFSYAKQGSSSTRGVQTQLLRKKSRTVDNIFKLQKLELQ